MRFHDLLLLITADSVATRSNAVNSKLQLRRDHVEELNQVHAKADTAAANSVAALPQIALMPRIELTLVCI